MKYTIELFLRALEHRLGFKDKFFVCTTSSVKNDTFPAYKTIKMEIWCVDGSYNELISTVQIVDRITNDEEKAIAEQKILTNTYENLLSFYGI